MSATELATQILEWETKPREIDTLRANIDMAVLEVGKTQMDGNQAGEQILAGQIDLDTINVWMEWPDRGHGSSVLEAIVAWLVIEVDHGGNVCGDDTCSGCGGPVNRAIDAVVCEWCYEAKLA